MKPNELEKIVIDRIYEGKSYQEVYDVLNAQFPNREIDLARLIAGNATMDQRTKNSALNIILSVVIIINIGFTLLMSFLVGNEIDVVVIIVTLIFVGFYAFLLLRVVKWDLRVYKFVGGLGLLGLIRISLGSVEAAVNSSISLHLMNPLNIIPLGMVVLGFYLHSKLGGKYKTASQQYKDAKGLIRARHTIQFQN